MAELINVAIHRGMEGEAPFMKGSVPVFDAENTTFSAFIRQEVVAASPNFAYDDGDIKVARSKSGFCMLRLLSLFLSYLLKASGDDDPIELTVVIDRPAVARTTPREDASDRLMANSRTKKTKFKSKFTLSDVQSFQAGYRTALNKIAFLKSMPSKNKPNEKEQVEAVVVSFLNNNNLVFATPSDGVGGEEKAAENSLKKTVATVLFVHQERNTLEREQISKFNLSQILKDAKPAFSVKQCQEKKAKTRQG